MELSAADLGNEKYLSLMHRRLTIHQLRNGWAANSSVSMADEVGEPLTGTEPKKRLRRGRRLRRYWVKGLGLDEQTGEKVADIAWTGGAGTASRVVGIVFSTYLAIGLAIALGTGNPGPAFMITMFWTILMVALAAGPRVTIRKQHNRQVTKGEIEVLLPLARGRLERSYLNLILDTLRQDIPSVSAQSDIRAALRDLGETISRLPGEAVPTPDPLALRREAQVLRVKAHAESDSFVSASLLRQAEACERRAALSGENHVPARRLAALRREARAQMDALRSVLVAFEHTSQADAAGITHLSEAVQHVAREAQAASIAQRELEEDELIALFGQPLPANTPPQPILPARKVVPVPIPSSNGQTQPSAPPQEAPQVVGQSRQWWRGQ